MIYIHKSQEPRLLTEYKYKVGASYEEMDSEPKTATQDQLLRDQGYLCAYCMRRINDRSEMRIEHWYPRNPDHDEYDRLRALDYNNMLAVCYGNEKAGLGEAFTTCDVHRHNDEIYINPCMIERIDQILYKSNGIIYSGNQCIQKDLQLTLNLNCEHVSLPQNRKAALDSLKQKMKRETAGMNNDKFKSYCQKIYRGISTADRKMPFVGILLVYLRDKIDR